MNTPSQPPAHPSAATPSRRALLTGGSTAALSGLLAVPAMAGAHPAATSEGHEPQGHGTPGRRGPHASPDLQFTLAVLPDTQYLFDDDSIVAEPLVASLKYLRRHRDELNLAFLAQLGDLTESGLPHEIAAFDDAWSIVRRARIPFATLTGNHDVDSSTTDQRGSTPYLQHFVRSTRESGVLAVSPDGYNSAHTFTAAGREWMVLALDWRLSEAGFAWADRMLTRHRHLPTILTTHDVIHADHGDGVGHLSDYGQDVWDRLIRRHDHVFLSINGHFWPTGRTVMTNDAGHETHLHLANYQQLYYGGAAALRLYRFDLARGVIDVETVVPWLETNEAADCALAREELTLTSDADRFSVEIDFAERFAGFAPEPTPQPRPAEAVLVRDTLAYWRWDQLPTGALDRAARIEDLSGHGNHLEVVSNGRRVEVVGEFHPGQPGHASLAFGGAVKDAGDYLRTVAGAPLNDDELERGYTIEAFFRMPQDWSDRDAWTSLLSRQGSAGEAGGTGGDAEEPVVSLNLSGERQLQFVSYPISQREGLTNWGHELRTDRWWHVAVVNDRKHTTMYVEGCPVARNPHTRNRGLRALDRRWLVGGYEWDGVLDAVTRTTLGDVRIVGRALSPREFMNQR